MTCPVCGALAPEGARFCPDCGQRLVAPPDERRLVTVLMADLVGFTTLSEAADPEQVKRLVDDCFERLLEDVRAFGGRLDKIVGDEMVAVFGTPVTHEDDAERAVRAALRMQDALAAGTGGLDAPVRMRVGINTGEVLVGAMRAGGDATVTGDVVNVAQRLEKLAGPGEVVVGPATFAATRGAIGYEALGAVSVKGREEPVDAYRAVRALAPPGRRRARGPTPFVGRAAELGVLRQALALAATRRRAQQVLVVGDAGVGKSRLASEAALHARDTLGARVLVGQSVPYGDANPYGALAEALRHACGVDASTAPGDARGCIRREVARVFGATDDAEVERVTEGLTQLVEGVTRPGVDPGRARDEAARAAAAFLEALAARRPVVLVLSDVHWAPDTVIELTERLLARLRSSPFVVLATARPGPPPAWPARDGRHDAVLLNLDPLDEAATTELVAALFEGAADDAVMTTLLERSGGNPLFVEELVAYLRESTTGDRMAGSAAPLRELPATLHGLVAARLDALDPSERSLLEDCAVVGTAGPVSAVVDLAGRPDAPGIVERLVERDLLVLDGDEFRFKSELIRDVAYGRLTKAQRARRHAALAPLLTRRGEVAIDHVANHFATAAELLNEIGDAADDGPDLRRAAVEALALAARRAEEAESWLAVERHNDRALRLLPDAATAPRWQALLGRGRARIAQRRLQEGEDDVVRVLGEAREAGDEACEAAALNLLGELHVARGEYDLAESVLGEAVTIWRRVGEVSGVANALRGLGISHLFRGEDHEAERLFSDALASYRSVGDRRGEAWALQNLAWIAFSRGDPATAERRLQHSAELFGDLGDWGGLGWAFGLLAFVRYQQGRLAEAAELAVQIAAEGVDAGNRWAVGMMHVLLANVALWTGRAADALRDAREAIALFEEIADRWGETQARAPAARALAELGRDVEAMECIERMRAVATTLPDAGMADIPVVVEAGIALQYGEPDRAERLLGGTRRRDDGYGTADRQGTLALVLLQQARVDEAVAVLEPGYAAAQYDGAALSMGSRLALGYAAAGRTGDARRVLGELAQRDGGTYHDRIVALWADACVRFRDGSGDVRAPVDAAHAIAAGTDAPLEHAIAAHVRALVLTALCTDDATAARTEADRLLAGLGVVGEGWTVLVNAALGEPDREPRPARGQ